MRKFFAFKLVGKNGGERLENFDKFLYVFL